MIFTGETPGTPGTWAACAELPPAPTSPRAARAILRLTLAEWDVGDLDSIDLLLTEVVTNAVVHAGTPFLVRLQGRPGWARVEVHDCSAAEPHRRGVTGRSEHGRGLLLLDRLANSWGWQHDAAGTSTRKSVWFELAAPGMEDEDRSDEALTAAFDLDTVPAL